MNMSHPTRMQGSLHVYTRGGSDSVGQVGQTNKHMSELASVGPASHTQNCVSGTEGGVLSRWDDVGLTLACVPHGHT
jgi:hypothetical protein